MKFLLAQLLCWTLVAAPLLHLAEGPEVRTALDHISADSMRGNLSFLASDELEGRDTPSRGLDIAAEFIASQFRRAGLDAPVDNTYFQTADFEWLTRRTSGLSLLIDNQGESLHLASPAVTILRAASAIHLQTVPVLKLNADSDLTGIDGKAVVVAGRGTAGLMRRLRQTKAALIVTLSEREGPGQAARELVAEDQMDRASVPVVNVRDEAARQLFESLPVGPTPATLTLDAPAPQEEGVKLRNVIGVLRGSDPQLKDSYIIVSAHYDHLGTNGGHIYNGANDDGSGVVSVIELASALASMHPHPRRSIIFMTVFGEEKGLLGSQYYSRHPVFPLNQTIADINLEQIGRTDDSEGPQVASATFTGFTYSDLPELFEKAGKTVGVKIYDRNPGNDPYFARSDNQALADDGIPSHTIAVALEFPDYHAFGDRWNKIDYTNMTSIDRMLGLGIISLADDPESPKWTESNPNTRKYREAWKSLHAASQN